MSFFGRENLQEAARLNPARPLATVGEATAAAWEEQTKLNSSFSAENSIYQEYEAYRSEVHAATGKRLFNPMSSRPASRADLEARFRREVESLATKFPQLVVKTPDSIRQKIAKDRQDIRQRSADVRARTVGFGPNAAAFAATAGAAITDPPVLLSLGFGAPWSAGILRTALTEFAIGAGSEAVVQVGVQAGRKQFGEEPDFAEAATVVGAAGLGGAALGALIKGGVRGTRALVARARKMPEAQRTTDADAAIKYLDRTHGVQDQNPFIRAALGRHMEESAAADRRMLLGGTAIARVIDADQPVRLKVEATDEVFGEPVAASLARAREAAPEVFRRVDEIEARRPVIAARLGEIEQRLDQPDTEVQIAASEIRETKVELKTATDRRATKRLQNKIARLEKKHGPNVAQKAGAQTQATNRLVEEKVQLEEELRGFDKEAPELARQQERAVRGLDQQEVRKARVLRVKQVIGADTDPVSRLARTVVDAADRFIRAAEGVDLPSSSALDTPVSPAVQHSMVPPDGPRKTELEQLAEDQALAELQANPEARFQVMNDDGSVSVVTAKEFLDDFADDEAFLRELADCVKGGL